MNQVFALTREFSRDVTAAMLVSLSKGMAAMLVSPTNLPGIELCSYANVFFCFWLKNTVVDHVCKNTLLEWLLIFSSFSYNYVLLLFLVSNFAISHFYL